MRQALRSPWVRLGLALALVALVGYAIYRLSDVLTPFAVAFAVAYFLNPAVNALERGFERLFARAGRLGRLVEPRLAAIALLCAVLVVALGVALVFVVPAASSQLAEAARKVPDWAKTLRGKVEPFLDSLNVRYPEQYEVVRERLVAALRDHLPDLLSPVTRGIRAAFSSALGFVLALLNVVVIPVFAVYLLYDMNRIRVGSRELVPWRFRGYVFSRVAQVDRLLSAFVRGQITVCLMLGVFYAVGLTACGVPMGLLVGMVIGFFNLIPFMSHVLGLPLALVLSWLDDQSLERLLAVALIFAFGQFVEGNFITPKIVGDSLGLHAVVVMLAVLVGGTLLGLIGMLIAVPVTAALSVFWSDLRDLYLRSGFYAGGRPPDRDDAGISPS